MPERNGMPWLEEALASVRAQNQAVEVTVIDDGSADHTREYLGIPARG
jgi:glycosyltransferase involved in cell wall biosynthesis